MAKLTEQEAQAYFLAIDTLRGFMPVVEVVAPSQAPFVSAGLSILFQMVAVARNTPNVEDQRKHVAEQITKNWQEAIDANLTIQPTEDEDDKELGS